MDAQGSGPATPGDTKFELASIKGLLQGITAALQLL